jgi:hypothetical protein
MDMMRLGSFGTFLWSAASRGRLSRVAGYVYVYLGRQHHVVFPLCMQTLVTFP